MKKKINLNFLDIVFIFINIFYKVFRHKLNFKITENFIDIKENHEIIYIIGTSPSIKLIKKNKFKRIKKNLSIGLNGFVFHWFKPSYYALENSYDNFLISKIKDSILKKNKKYNRSKCKIFLYNKLKEKNNFKILKYLPFTIKYASVRPLMLKKISLEKKINIYHSIIKKWKLPLTVGFGSTLERMISLSIMLKPKKIILVGIDLNSSNHFYDKQDRFIIDNYSTNSHPTSQKKKDGSKNIFKTIKAFQKCAKKEKIILGIYSKKSLLAKFLPVIHL